MKHLDIYKIDKHGGRGRKRQSPLRAMLQKTLAVFGILALVWTTAGVWTWLLPVARAADDIGPFSPSANPTLDKSCGLDIALVIDSSGSINSTELAQMKSAFQSFVSAFLPATPTEFSVTDFGDTAAVLQNFTNSPALLTAALQTPTSGGFTNWDDGLAKAQNTFPNRPNPDLVILASDGNPNRFGNPSQPSSGVYEAGALQAAILRANALKNSGTRIMALGIGDDLSLANLEAISSADAVYTSDFLSLASDLAALADDLCGGTITAHKILDADSDLNTTGDQTPGALWDFDVAGSAQIADESGKTQAVEVVPGTYSVAETLENGYSFISASCSGATQNGNAGQGSVSGIEVGANDIVSCSFYNSPNPGTLTIIKQVINDDAGTSTPADFSIHVKQAGVDVAGSPAPGSGAGTQYALNSGTYTVSEDPVPGYSTAFSGDCDASGNVVLNFGENKTCTIINDDLAATDGEGEGSGGRGSPSLFTFTVTTSGDGQGTVTDDSGKIHCDSAAADDDCSETYEEGLQITLTAIPADGSNFDNSWSGACTDSNPVCQITVNQNLNVNAHFGANSNNNNNNNASGGGSGGEATSGGSGSVIPVANPNPTPPVNPPSAGTSGGEVAGARASSDSDSGSNPPAPEIPPEIQGQTLPRTGSTANVLFMILAAGLLAVRASQSRD